MARSIYPEVYGEVNKNRMKNDISLKDNTGYKVAIIAILVILFFCSFYIGKY